MGGRAWRGALAGAALMVICTFGGLLCLRTIGWIWHGVTGQVGSGGPADAGHGRDLRDAAWAAAIFIAMTGAWWSRRSRRERTADAERGRLTRSMIRLCGPVLIVEIAIAGLVGGFSGSYAVNSLFIDWMLGASLLVCLPWFAGVGCECILSAVIERGRRKSSS